LLARACLEVEKKGGQPILIMTDSIFWKGTADMLPADMVRYPKTVGYFEPPERVTDMVCLGSGRYGYKTAKGYMQSKKRGLNAVDIHDPDGLQMDEFNWLSALEIMKKTNSDKILVTVRVLVSVGMVLHNSAYNVLDLGRVVEEIREVDAIVGRTKRVYNADLKDATLLSTQLVTTTPIYLFPSMFGDGNIIDQTLPELRAEMMKLMCVTSEDKIKNSKRKYSNKYYKEKKAEIDAERNNKYKMLKDYGYKPSEAKQMRGWHIEKIKERLTEDGKI